MSHLVFKFVCQVIFRDFNKVLGSKSLEQLENCEHKLV